MKSDNSTGNYSATWKRPKSDSSGGAPARSGAKAGSRSPGPKAREGTLMDGIINFLDTIGGGKDEAAMRDIIRKRNAAALQRAVDAKSTRDGAIRKKTGGY